MLYQCSHFVPSRLSIMKIQVGGEHCGEHQNALWHFIIMWKCEIPIISLENTWISYNNWNNLSKEKDTRSNPTTCTCIYVTLKYHHINAPYVSILNMEKRTIKSLEFLLTFKTLKHWNVRTLNVIIIFIPITMLFGTDNIMRNNFPYSN